ncbi:LacI family DNA-binding transcriptional regulator, partial [Paenibacillus anseongense]
MNITSKQIAELCGVTRGTVDRALNNRPGIHPDTRDKIMRVAEELGYRPHFLAQSLVKGHTKTLGIV